MAEQVSVGIIGCGKMGTALLQGFLYSKAPLKNAVKISHVNVSVRQQAQVLRLHGMLQSIRLTDVTLDPKIRLPSVSIHLHGENARLIRDSEIVIICCKPSAFTTLLSDPGVKEALFKSMASRVLVSIMGGVTIEQLEDCLYSCGTKEFANTDSVGATTIPAHRLTIMRIIPNIAACIRESITVVSSPPPSLDNARDVSRVVDLFSLLGSTIQLPESQFNMASALASSSIAFYADLISASAGGELSHPEGSKLSRNDCLWISAHAARGASGLIIGGKVPKDIIGQVATKHGSTEVGLLIMENSKVKDAMVSAVLECAKATANLSKIEDK